MLSGYIQKYSTDKIQQIDQRAFNLRQLLRIAELSSEGCDFLQEHLLPLLNNKLAVETLKKYMERCDVNYANKNRVTLLHLLVLYFPHLAGYLLADLKFTCVNYKTECLQNGLYASALDIALSRWLDGEYSHHIIERLLKYGARVPKLDERYMPGRSFLLGICFETLFAEYPERTEDEMVSMLALLGRYGFDLVSAHSEFARDWLADEATVARIEDETGLSTREQCGKIDNLLKRAFTEFLKTNKTESEFLVELTHDRLATAPPMRRISSSPEFRLYADRRQPQSSVAAVVYGDDNHLPDEDLAALFKPS